MTSASTTTATRRSSREQRYRTAEQALWDRTGHRPTERRVRLPRLGVEVRIQEVGEGPPALLVHGGPNAGTTWATLVEHLPGLRCLVLDRPGTGLSEPMPPGRYDLRHLAEVLVVDVLDGLGLERAHLVGSSMGGYLCLRAAERAPERIERMVQHGCPPFVPGSEIPAFMRMAMLPGAQHVLHRLPASRGAGRWVLRQIGHGPTLDAGGFPPEFEEWRLALERHTDTMREEYRLIAAASVARRFDEQLSLTAERLASIPTPTLWLWGDNDPFGSVEVARDVSAQVPRSDLVVLPGAGHLPWLDDPAGTGDATRRFLLDGR